MHIDTTGNGGAEERCRQCNKIRAPKCNVAGCFGEIVNGRCASCEARARWKVEHMPPPVVLVCPMCNARMPRKNAKHIYCGACAAVRKDVQDEIKRNAKLTARQLAARQSAAAVDP
jgi:hypothetical protein